MKHYRHSNIEFLVNLLSVEVAEWLEHLGPYLGDRWFDSRRGLFAEKSEYFMIFEIYLQSDSDCKLAGVSIEFKSRRSSGSTIMVEPFLITYRLELSIEDMYVCGHFLGGKKA